MTDDIKELEHALAMLFVIKLLDMAVDMCPTSTAYSEMYRNRIIELIEEMKEVNDILDIVDEVEDD